MIELPDEPSPNGVEIEVIDFGMTLRPGGGASPLRVNRAGTRLRARVTWPPMQPDTARKFWGRLQKAKREGLRIEYPLLGVNQGSPGEPVVDGAGPSGIVLPLRGLTPNYPIKEGYVLTLIDAGGERYTHFSMTAGFADSVGALEIEVEPPIRGVFADGDTVLLAKPTIEGAIEDLAWALSLDRMVRGFSLTIEETAGLDPSLGS